MSANTTQMEEAGKNTTTNQGEEAALGASLDDANPNSHEVPSPSLEEQNAKLRAQADFLSRQNLAFYQENLMLKEQLLTLQLEHENTTPQERNDCSEKEGLN